MVSVLALWALVGCEGPPVAVDLCTGAGLGTLSVSLVVPEETWITAPALDVYNEAGTVVATVTTPTDSLELSGGMYVLAMRRGIAPPTDVAGLGVKSAFGSLGTTHAVVCVGDDATTEFEATWEEQPSSGAMWVTYGEHVFGFDQAALLVGNELPIVGDLFVDLSNDLRGFAVDAYGNLWTPTSPTYGARVVKFEPGAVLGGESVAFGGPAFDEDAPQIEDIAFDDKEQLWLLIRHSNTAFVGLWGFSAAAVREFLAFGTLPGDPVRITVDGLVAPEDIAFDLDGSMWIADFGGDQLVNVGLSSIEGAAAGSWTPSDTFHSTYYDATGSHTLTGPTTVDVDDNGRVWVNWFTAATVTRFDDPTDIGNRIPSAIKSADVLDLPSGLAIDHAGSVWYGNEPQNGTGELVQLDQETLVQGTRGTSVNVIAPRDLVFDPR